MRVYADLNPRYSRDSRNSGYKKYAIFVTRQNQPISGAYTEMLLSAGTFGTLEKAQTEADHINAIWLESAEAQEG